MARNSIIVTAKMKSSLWISANEAFLLRRSSFSLPLKTYHQWQLEGFDTSVKGVPEYWYCADFEEVKEKGFSLVSSKYVEFINRDEEIDFDAKMKSIQKDMKQIIADEEKSSKSVITLFNELGFKLD